MDRVLVIGRIRPERRRDVEAALPRPVPGLHVFRHGDTLALLVEGGHADARFLRLIEEGAALAPVVACLEDVPLVPGEVDVSDLDQAFVAATR